MIRILLTLFGFAFIISLNAQSLNPEYDSTLARKLGADDYGMKSYFLVILKSGTNNMAAGPERDLLFKGHLANINRLAEEGKLVIAGPLGENIKGYRGIFILNVKTVDEARKLLSTDPVIREKILDADLYKWYGSAAIGEYLKVAKKIEKSSF